MFPLNVNSFNFESIIRKLTLARELFKAECHTCYVKNTDKGSQIISDELLTVFMKSP